MANAGDDLVFDEDKRRPVLDSEHTVKIEFIHIDSSTAVKLECRFNWNLNKVREKLLEYLRNTHPNNMSEFANLSKCLFFMKTSQTQFHRDERKLYVLEEKFQEKGLCGYELIASNDIQLGDIVKWGENDDVKMYFSTAEVWDFKKMKIIYNLHTSSREECLIFRYKQFIAYLLQYPQSNSKKPFPVIETIFPVSRYTALTAYQLRLDYSKDLEYDNPANSFLKCDSLRPISYNYDLYSRLLETVSSEMEAEQKKVIRQWIKKQNDRQQSIQEKYQKIKAARQQNNKDAQKKAKTDKKNRTGPEAYDILYDRATKSQQEMKINNVEQKIWIPRPTTFQISVIANRPNLSIRVAAQVFGRYDPDTVMESYIDQKRYTYSAPIRNFYRR